MLKMLGIIKSRGSFLIFIILLLVVYNYSIIAKEKLLQSGKAVILELQPLDPRSLMQGDYVELRFRAGTDVENELWQKEEASGSRTWRTGYQVQLPKGFVVLKLKDGYHHFQKIYTGESLEQDEVLLEYKQRHNRVVFAGGTFFMQEGFGMDFERQAKFALIRVDSNGKGIISTLLDAQLQEITVKNLQDKKSN